MKRMLFLFALWPALSSPTLAQVQGTHCTPNETPYFSCSTGKKVVSICGSKSVSPSAGYLQYRFGVVGKTEAEFPASKENPSKYFTYSHFMTANGNTSYTLSVINGQYKYTIDYSEILRSDRMSGGGLTIYRDQKKISEIPCKSLHINDLYKLKDSGLPEEADSSPSAEQPAEQTSQPNINQKQAATPENQKEKSRTGAEKTDAAAVKNASKVSQVGFSKAELRSMIYTRNDLINPLSDFVTLEGVLGALFELEKIKRITAVQSGKSKGFVIKVPGVQAVGFLFRFDDGEAFITHMVQDDEATRLTTKEAEYAASMSLLQLVAAALGMGR